MPTTVRRSVRPERLVIEGFTTFRERTEIDFTGADLFALTGATGAGKSSIIDAIVFALYGTIPRLDDKRTVAPVISQDKVEARVQLDFSLDDHRYRAVRVVREQTGKSASAPRRSGRLATTKEARLERLGDAEDGEVLAGNADELTAVVTELLGLSFEHFTTCVVLPQGQFARFLHHKPRDRQDLLVELLDLGVYGRMGTLARSRAVTAEKQAEWLTKERERYQFASPEAREQCEARVVAIEGLRTALDEAQPRIEAAELAVRDRQAQAADAREVVGLLGGVAIPPGVDEIASVVAARTDELRTARAAVVDATERFAVAEKVLDDLPDRASLELAKRDHDDAARLRDRIDRGQAVVDDAETAEQEARGRAEQAASALESATGVLDAARVANRAADLAQHLVVGEACPVCGNEVRDVVEHEAADLAAATKAEARARKTAESMAAKATEATADRTRKDDLLTDLQAQLLDVEARLADAPPAADIDGRLAASDAAAAEVRQCRADEQQARAAVEASEHALAAAESAAASGWAELDARRDRLAVLQPPAVDRSDLGAAWSALHDWSTGAAEQYTAELTTIEHEVVELGRERDELVAGVLDACATAEVAVAPGQPPRDAAVEALADAKADVASITDAMDRLAELDGELAGLATTAELASALGRHLGAKGFEKWMLDEALDRLVAGASTVLFELSDHAYSLVLDSASSTFFVKDHYNADAMRSARTLSGGETFLASLALALALADQLAELAAGGAVRLESIFLDEGFGTLDPDTLDTVATAIEELGAQGRMVGLVSHVAALADRMPVRFIVTKGPITSTVERMES
jgi:exonuclease SbcC